MGKIWNFATRNDPIAKIFRAEKLQKMIEANPTKPLNNILNDFCTETGLQKRQAVECYEMLVKRKKIKPRNEKIEV